MQAIERLEQVLVSVATCERYMFSGVDLQGALPGYSGIDLLLCRAQKACLLKRVCRGIYL
jgi:hypothetical protein